MNEIKEKLRTIYVNALELAIPPDEVGDAGLIHQLNIDSLKSLELLIWVEDEFQMTVEDEDLSPDLVDSLDVLAAYITRRRQLQQN